jgi:hypothetical protein
MARSGRRARRAERRDGPESPVLNVGRSVENSRIGGSPTRHQVVNVHIEGGTAVDDAARRLAASVSARVAEETGRRSVRQTEQPIVLRVASTERPVQARGRMNHQLLIISLSLRRSRPGVRAVAGASSAVPLVGNTVPATAARSYQVVAGISTNAIIGDGFARLVVTDDDTAG